MEKIFRALPCTERQKVTFATFTFKDDAQEWWLLALEKEDIVTWARFLEAFYEKNFPDLLWEQNTSEFIHLRQGPMTVAEYESKFTQLARFATYVIPIEARKARKFEAGLDPEIKDRLEVLKLPTYAKVVDRAYIMEKGIKTLRSGEPGQRKRLWERDNRRPDVAPPKKVNTGTTSSTSSNNQGPTNPRGDTIPACSTYGRTHWGQCRRDTRACFRCGQAGHLLRNCPKLANPTTGPSKPIRKPTVPGGVKKDQKRQGRAFALVSGNPEITENIVSDLIPFYISTFDVILGMDWLAAHRASIDCEAKKVFLQSPNQLELIFKGLEPLPLHVLYPS
ncbi:uncharacterized protein LOC114270304 [Camellia sinensis]|uniref:uncharacterized protein LOC114270304 n=1 Tax=Camellia sinensis TaxID=4442 RepID=UPI0010356B47|nr:uncharacterized protein LOC114270304 [Camellia sinensis]